MELKEKLYNECMTHVCIVLVRSAMNRKLLEFAVHRDIDDLSVIVYKSVPKGPKEPICPRLVTKSMVREFEVSEEKFMDDAIAASARNFPASTQKLATILDAMGANNPAQ